MAIHTGVLDDGSQFQIVPHSRKIMVPTTHTVIGTAGEHNSEQITFMCPKSIDGHDVVNCSSHYVSWMNANGGQGFDPVTDITTDEDNLYFKWVIPLGLTLGAGKVKFAVRFEDFDENGELTYSWGSAVCEDCEILEGLNYKMTRVPIPDGYVKPEGTFMITEDGDYDVSGYEFVSVWMGSIVPVTVNFYKPDGTLLKTVELTNFINDGASQLKITETGIRHFGHIANDEIYTFTGTLVSVRYNNTDYKVGDSFNLPTRKTTISVIINCEETTETIINLHSFYGGGVTKYTYEGDVSVTWGTNGDAPNGQGVMYFNNEEIYNIGVEDLAGLSIADDKNISSDGDIPYGTTKTLKGGKEYTFYTYVESEIEDKTTTVTLYRPDGTFLGTLTTESDYPQMRMTMEDSGELYLTSATGGDWGNGSAIYVARGGDYPEGFSLDNDGNITSEGDIVWSNSKTINLTVGANYTYYVLMSSDIQCQHTVKSYHRISGTYTHSVYCEDCYTDLGIESCVSDGGGSCKFCYESYPETTTKITTLIIYNADGTLRGKLTTTHPQPVLFFQLYDSGEVGITDGVPAESTGSYYNNTILFSYNACPMAGLSVNNDKNLTSTGDIVWENNESNPSQGAGNKKTLTAGNTYVYFGYKNSDLQTSGGGSSGGTTCTHTSKSYTSLGNRQHKVTCNSCGTTWTEACTDDGGGSCSKCYGPY